MTKWMGLIWNRKAYAQSDTKAFAVGDTVKVSGVIESISLDRNGKATACVLFDDKAAPSPFCRAIVSLTELS